MATFVFLFSPILRQYCKAIFIAISIAVEPLSEKKTDFIFGLNCNSFLDNFSADGCVRLNKGVC